MPDRKVTAMSASGVPVDATDLLYLVRVGDANPDRKLPIPDLRESITTEIINNFFLSTRRLFTCTTVNNTPTELLDGDGNRLEIDDDSSIFFRLQALARRTDANESAVAWRKEGIVDRNAGTVAEDAGGQLEFTFDSGGHGWTLVAAADDVNKAISLFATTENGKTIRVACFVEWVQVIG